MTDPKINLLEWDEKKNKWVNVEIESLDDALDYIYNGEEDGIPERVGISGTIEDL